MSGGAVFRESLRRLRRAALPEEAERDVVSALEAGRAGDGPLQFVYDAGTEAGLPREEILCRGAAIFFSFCAGNLADDLVDGDCDYLDPPIRLGPTVQFILQHLSSATFLASAVTRDDLMTAAELLARAAGPQQLEVRTDRWTLERAKLVAEGVAGLQFAAYLCALWSGTPLSERAISVGGRLGIAAHVAMDLASNDPRSLEAAERDALVRWAREAHEALAKEELRSVDAALVPIGRLLGAEP